ncbi:MAG TPA: imidazole glycerol phosphate synthase subunit HisF [Gemmatimonadota bacterium]|nr:imidazole glycerol phosphate synthase subunit HisF [Gemmatimonadota bacterium]
MLTRRIIPCLDVDDGRVVKGVRFRGLRDAGDPAELAALYAGEGADELVFLDISATPERRATAVPLAERVARELSIPFTVGGGLRTLEDVRAVLHAGADRVALNTAAVREPGLVRRAAELFGSQAVVVAVDARRTGGDDAGPRRRDATGAGAPRRDAPGPGPWTVRVRSGTREAGLDAVEWCRRAAGLGAGEILLTSMDRDGTKEGYDVELIAAVAGAVTVPVVASGGAGRPEDFLEAFEAGADAALAASLFHFGELRIPELKAWLAERGVPVRPASEARPLEGRGASERRRT